ncbi:hypothetical protein BX616_002132 [Lobosporangium transversale]|uniref:Concanavalin A-like lectin/glucanase domain-containing protein n=1 Tax=Lobosporangium transversale TaxID=64571 RepID=A0A1Y2G530_9FUNG|nr:hypothetical protein BCR41DRAFT_390899 [Lobosporangium transversale]KAF9917025.1 hypothetical protein BX616_002132 [Lobosporangium transversale]ORY94280.1 hypothetical protein BCR41DRAFT_390899 [Lobosporangium transversale]|eukprot:XP_021875223.1 hypothetical protein BCR41DRAFT_390899 [Lobosporangium transversale]
MSSQHSYNHQDIATTTSRSNEHSNNNNSINPTGSYSTNQIASSLSAPASAPSSTATPETNAGTNNQTPIFSATGPTSTSEVPDQRPRSIHTSVDNPPSSVAAATVTAPTTTAISPSPSGQAQTSLSIIGTNINVGSSVFSLLRRHFPTMSLNTDQQQQQQQQQDNSRASHLPLPLPEREDSSRTRSITFGTLKKASMSGYLPSSSSSSASAATSATMVMKKSKMTTLPSYFQYTTFKQYFQPEGPPIDLQTLASTNTDREPSKRRRLHLDSHRRRHTHFRQDSDSSSSSSGESTSGGGGSSSSGSSSGSESANSSFENERCLNNSTNTNHDNNSNSSKPDRPPLRYQLPSRWSTVDKTDKTRLSEDDLQAHYFGPGEVDSDAASIRANRPIPPQCGVYYYEVMIKSKGQKGYIGIGVCSAMVPLDRLPGWEPQSWGYHGDDGNSFGGCGNGRPYGPVFTTGDVIGCGINFRDMSLFYTKNGVYLGVAFRDLKGTLYPTVGMRTAGEVVEANFGQREFVYNIEDYVMNEKIEAWQTLENSLQSTLSERHQMSYLSQSLSELILSYMIHHGYSESAKQFSNDLLPTPLQRQGSSTSAAKEFQNYPPLVLDTERRKEIRDTILAGEIDRAMELLDTYYPGITMENEDMLLQLRCRKFVEMVNKASTPLRKLDQQKTGKGKGKDKDKDTVKGEIKSHPRSFMDVEMTDVNRGEETMEIDQERPPPSSISISKRTALEQGDYNSNNSNRSEGLEELGDMLKDAIQYGQSLHEQYKDNRRLSVQEMLVDSFAILAYSDADHTAPTSLPATKSLSSSSSSSSSLSHPLPPLHSSSSSSSSHHHRHHHQHQHRHGSKPISREKVANTVNTAILASQDLPTIAPLETIYRQTNVVMSELTRLGVGSAAFLDVEKDCLE